MAINLNKLIYPYFVIPGKDRKEPIESFPEVYRFSVDRLLPEIAEAKKSGIKNILLFGIPDKKDILGSEAFKEGNIVSLAVSKIKSNFKNLTVFTDVCLCAYTSHGHCGIIKKGKREINSGKTLKALSYIALAHARAGADWVAPSAMAKGQVKAIRKILDKHNFKKTKILGYSSKFNSSFYGPFRKAAGSSPKFADRSAYQLDYADPVKALKKIKEDIDAGANMVMVKPALGYLDIISKAKDKFRFPLAAYNVSGEYALLKYGAGKNILDEKKAVKEILAAISRAGADFIITYHAKDVARWIKQKNF